MQRHVPSGHPGGYASEEVWITHAGGVEADPSKSAPVKGKWQVPENTNSQAVEAEDGWSLQRRQRWELSDTGQKLGEASGPWEGVWAQMHWNLLSLKPTVKNGSLQTEMAGHLLARKGPFISQSHWKSHRERVTCGRSEKQPVTTSKKIMRWPTWPNGRGHMDFHARSILGSAVAVIVFKNVGLQVRLPVPGLSSCTAPWETRLLSKMRN